MSTRRIFCTFFAGLVLVQAAWITAMPAFRGPDEFDHVYRAEGVARGQVTPGPAAAHARGELTHARESVVDAATKACETYTYTRTDNCEPVDDLGAGMVTVASGAGRYNPSYYAVVGTIARPFTGVAVDYAIRIVTAVLAALLLAWAAAIWVRERRSTWPALGLLTAMTPVLVYSTAIAAPNGLTYAGAILFWVAGLDLSRTLGSDPHRGTLTALAVGAVVLCNTHTTGPLWLLLSAVALLMLAPLRQWWALARTGAGRRTMAVIAGGGLVAAGWTLLSGANTSSVLGTDSTAFRIADLAKNEVLWLFQVIAVFPLRNESAPPVVYVLWLVPFVALLTVAVRLGGRTRWTLGFLAGCALVIPTVLTLISYGTEGFAWQGRYALPLTVGLVLVPAAIADQRWRLTPRWYVVLAGLMTLATAISVGHVADHEANFVVTPASAHLVAGPVIVGLTALGGGVLMAVALARRPLDDTAPASDLERAGVRP